MKVPDKLIEGISESRSVIIASHLSPDGDAIGASLAFAIALKVDCGNLSAVFRTLQQGGS